MSVIFKMLKVLRGTVAIKVEKIMLMPIMYLIIYLE